MSAAMKVDFGVWEIPRAIRTKYQIPNDKYLPVRWQEDQVINGHIMIAGGSGTGKTHSIRKMCEQMCNTANHELTIHVFDVHDDIELPNCSDIIFSESTTVGLNPLLIDPDPHTGGVRKAIQNLISTINKTSRQLGERQEAVLRGILEELYAANGFYPDDPSSWSIHNSGNRSKPKKNPNIDDLYRWTYFKYRQMFLSGSSKSASALDQVNKEANKIQKMIKAGNASEHEEKLDKLKKAAIDSYTEYVENIKTGKELDELLKFDSKSTLKSVLDRIDNLRNTGVFRNEAPNFDPSLPIWRYRIKHLGAEEKKMFVFFRLQELYKKALQRGVQDNIVEVIILDEANMFMDSDPDNIISVMANQIRKFGTAIVCASQSFTHFTDDFISSVATKIILGIDEMYWDKTCRQLQIKKEWLEKVIGRKTALINMKRSTTDPRDPSAGIKWFFARV
tara:strand:+ start:7890 stop:9236 length:1347 start_codon:yes stop_codon:yes gene_type:complete